VSNLRRSDYTLIQGDALDVFPLLEDKSHYLTLTSPPFKDKEVPEPYYDWLDNVLGQLTRISNVVLMFNSSTRLKDICRRYDPRRILMWDKKVSLGAYRYEPIFVFCNEDVLLDGRGRIWNDCIAVPPIVGRYQQVPYQNPVKLYEQLLRYFPDAQTVLDPFGGAGTTMMACQNLAKSCLMIEINPQYCETIKINCFGKTFLDRSVQYSFRQMREGQIVDVLSSDSGRLARSVS